MGAALQGSSTSRRGRRRYRPMSEINVTPFVDVMLVLLIVFMVTAPLLTVGVPVDLPQTQAGQIPTTEEPLVVSVDSQGRVYLQDTEVEAGTLVARLRAITGMNPQARIFVRGDRTVAYGRIMEVMGEMTAAGFGRVALIGVPPGVGGGTVSGGG